MLEMLEKMNSQDNRATTQELSVKADRTSQVALVNDDEYGDIQVHECVCGMVSE